jgi:hypothetical protein
MNIFKKVAKLEEQNVELALKLVELKKELEDLKTWVKCHEDGHDIDQKNTMSSFRRLGAEVREIKERLPEYEEAVAKGVDDVWNKAVQSIVDFNPFKTGGDG